MTDTTATTTYGEGDTFIINNVLPKDLEKIAFKSLKNNVHWNKMQHHGGDIPRLICVQGLYETHKIIKRKSESDTNNIIESVESYPLYRHPADSQLACEPFIPIVGQIAEALEKVVNEYIANNKENHEQSQSPKKYIKFNHVLIQHYRNGLDLITEHADKTVDIEKDSFIVNLSLGETRNMTLRTKEKDTKTNRRIAQTIPLENNSLFVLGLETNKKWVHGIRPDKRGNELISGDNNNNDNDKENDNEDDNGGRISLTFRSIGTFATIDNEWIFGIGSKNETDNKNDKKEEEEEAQIAHKVISDSNDEQVEELFHMFSTENKSTTLSRFEIYGNGSNVIMI